MLYKYLKEHIIKNPDCAIRYKNETITYKQLVEYAEAFGEMLENDKYGILCGTELETAKAVMACLYAGKTAVLLSERYGKLHTEKIIDKIKLTHIITDGKIKQAKRACAETEDLGDVALILCTSGTTGNPKGSMLTDRNIISNIEDMKSFLHYPENGNILIARPLYHCAVLIGEFFMSLVRGVNICFFDTTSPADVIGAVGKYSINVLCGTPTMLYHISRLARRQNLPLNVVVCSGECMTKTVAEKMRSVMPDTKIINVYGLTEASPRVSYLKSELFDNYPTSVGRFIKSVTGRIKNGELLLKGDNIMKGYYGDKKLTTEKIRDGWFYTGDNAEIIDGLLYIKGRMDDLIIRGGMNIYPQELENALKKDKRVTEAFVFGTEDIKVGQKIHLWVECKNCTKQDILDICIKNLPSYQIPDYIDIVDKIPRNASGKIIRAVNKKPVTAL